MTNTKAFFDAYSLKYGSLKQSQVNGINQLLSFGTGLDRRHFAYMLATVKHECADTWKPITEYGSKDYFNKYDADTRLGQRLGNIVNGDGYRYRGRGYVQITGRANYERLGDVIGIDLINNPSLALDPFTAFHIMKEGMEKGLFTGKKLSDYINQSCNYLQARRIINGMDRAALIAGYAKFFEGIL